MTEPKQYGWKGENLEDLSHEELLECAKHSIQALYDLMDDHKREREMTNFLNEAHINLLKR